MTKDLGASWQYLKSYVFDFAWGTTVYSSSLSGGKNVEGRIFITHDPELKGHQKTRERWKQSVHLYYSDDFFKTQKNALDAGNSIVMTNHYMFVAKAISSDAVKIHVSRAEAGFLDFRLARMPKDYHITDHFTVMDTSEKSVFLYVSDDKVADPVGNLFISDGLGYRFSHSLENIIKGGYAVDFETVESLDGTYIANRYDVDHGRTNNHGAGQLREVTEEDILEEEAGQAERSRMSNSGTANKKQALTLAEGAKATNRGSLERLEAFNQKIKTYITHNKGATWELIRAPEADMRGQSFNCFSEDGCSLHLHMYTNNDQMYAPPYSQESAVGIVMAVGSLGERLDFERGARKGTFLSRDGGLEWSEIAKIPLIYEFGDHGGLLVASPNTASTTQVRYSWNEGKTWTKLKVSDTPIFIDNIIIEPKSTAQQFVIYGSHDNSTEEAVEGADAPYHSRVTGDDVMITLDFSGLHEPRCKGVDKPGTDDSDFELWSPHDDGRHGSSNKCFLGQQVTYIRRKQDVECFNGEDFERQTMRVPCLCTEADYECDMNYAKNKGGKCEALPDPLNKYGEQQLSEKDEDCALEGYYSISQGYRKIPGDMCYGGVRLDPVKKPCSSYAWFTSVLSLKTVVLTALAAVCLYYGWPLLEALIIVLPIPDPKESMQMASYYTSSAFDYVKGTLYGGLAQRGSGGAARTDYSSNLEAPPDAFMDPDDDSEEEDVGKAGGLGGRQTALDYDSDENVEVEGTTDASGSSELIDLGGDDEAGLGGAASSIPKLSAPL